MALSTTLPGTTGPREDRIFILNFLTRVNTTATQG